MTSERTKRRDFLALTLITKKKIIKERREMKNDKQESVLWWTLQYITLLLILLPSLKFT